MISISICYSVARDNNGSAYIHNFYMKQQNGKKDHAAWLFWLERYTQKHRFCLLAKGIEQRITENNLTLDKTFDRIKWKNNNKNYIEFYKQREHKIAHFIWQPNRKSDLVALWLDIGHYRINAESHENGNHRLCIHVFHLYHNISLHSTRLWSQLNPILLVKQFNSCQK